jgi:cytochrome c biogenesis protein CcmG, thiol:disulfide interchange protein DsbE
MTPASKLLILCMIVGFTLLYSVVEKRKIDALQVQAKQPILQQMPTFTAVNIADDLSIDESFLYSRGERGSFVHFWGTWCAPCEAELPEFVEFAGKFENAGVSFLLLAVNDEIELVKRFIQQRLNRIPENIIIAVDEKGDTLAPFGTVKVPETYLFNQELKTLTKFVGPQDWLLPGFIERTHRLLSGKGD